MNTIIRSICCAIFLAMSNGVSASEIEPVTKFIIKKLDDGRICGMIQVKKKNPGFFPVLILQHQVVRKSSDGIERVGPKTEDVFPLSSGDGLVWHCFTPLRDDQYQVSQWFILFAGKMHTIMFDDGAGGGSNELIWDATGSTVPLDVIRKEDTKREVPPMKDQKPNHANRKMLS